MFGCLECIYRELLKHKELKVPDIIYEFLTNCKESCNDALEIVSSLLSFEKIAAGLEKLELEVVLVREYVYKVSRPFVCQARAKGVEMTVEVNDVDENTYVKIDPVKMAQVLRNFFSNAVKFTAEHQKILVTTRGEKMATGSGGDGDGDGSAVAGAVTVLVTDKGPGLTTEQLSKLFQEGVQFNANQNQAGCVSFVVAYLCHCSLRLCSLRLLPF